MGFKYKRLSLSFEKLNSIPCRPCFFHRPLMSKPYVGTLKPCGWMKVADAWE